VKTGILDNREYDAAAWGRDLIGLTPPFLVWEVARPDPHPSFWIVTDQAGEVVTAGDDGLGCAPTPGSAAAVARHAEQLRRDAIEAEQWREVEAPRFERLAARFNRPAGYAAAPRPAAYLGALEGGR
jgi:hypothetical protein